MKNCLFPLLITLTLETYATQAYPSTGDEDLYALSLEELSNVKVALTSLLPTNQLEAGSSIDVISNTHWQAQGARRTLDTVSHLPATIVLPMHLGADALAIRGYGSVSSYSGTAMHWDGVPLNDLFVGGAFINLPNINLDTLDSIELIRGPGSALFGSDAFHGVLALKAFESEHDKRQISAQFASNDYYSVGGRWSAQATPNARVHLAAASSGQGDQERRYRFQDLSSPQELSAERAHDYAANTLTLKLSQNDDSTWSYGGGLYLHDYETEGFSGLGTALSGKSDMSAVDTRFEMAQLNTTRKFATSSLEFQAYLWQMDVKAATFIQFSEDMTVERQAPRDQQRYGGKVIYRRNDDTRNTRWAWATGADQIEITDADTLTFSAEGDLLNSSTHAAKGAERTISYLILEADTRWSDGAWRVIYGGRYDEYSEVGGHFSPRLGLIYFPLDETAIKLLYGNAFRAPSALELNGASGVQGNRDLDPEILDSYELVVIKQSPQWRLQGEIFHSEWSKTIVAAADADTPGTFRYTNLDRSSSDGATLSVEHRFTSWLLAGSASYVESKNETNDIAFGMFPRFILDLSVGYDFYRYATEFILNQRYYSPVDDVLEPEAGFESQELSSYWRTDITLNHHLSQDFDVIATARNLFDRENILPSPMGSRGGIPDERFNFSLGFRLTL